MRGILEGVFFLFAVKLDRWNESEPNGGPKAATGPRARTIRAIDSPELNFSVSGIGATGRRCGLFAGLLQKKDLRSDLRTTRSFIDRPALATTFPRAEVG
jgi:hypothetical protein